MRDEIYRWAGLEPDRADAEQIDLAMRDEIYRRAWSGASTLELS